MQPQIVAMFDYRDADGKLLYQVCRLEPGNNGESKSFLQRTPDGKAWKWGLNGVAPTLYRLPELLSEPTRAVFIVEGEKDVETLRSIGLIATTNPMGAGKWRAEYGEHLKGRQVIILPDNDEPGRKHGANVAAKMRRIAASVRIVELPDLPPKGDVTDWLAIPGNDKVKMLEFIQSGGTKKPTPTPTLKQVVERLESIEKRMAQLEKTSPATGAKR